MSDNIARLIAGASALMASGGFGVSLATYRRARPRLKMKTTVGTLIAIDEAENESHHLTYEIRLTNHGGNVVLVGEDLWVSHSSHVPRNRRFLPMGSAQREAARIMSSRLFLPDDAPRRIEPYNSVLWQVKQGASEETMKTYSRIRLTLPGGEVMYSPWQKPSSMTVSGTMQGFFGSSNGDDPALPAEG